MVATARPTCTFCGALGPLTEEHILSQRAVKLFEAMRILTGDAIHFTEIKPTRHLPQDAVLPELKRAFADRKRHKSSKRFYSKTVCASCNNGWMRQLDEDAFWFVEAAAATFRGRFDLPLDASNVLSLARWALMKTLCTFSRDGDLILDHHKNALLAGRMPDDVKVEILQSRIYGFHAFAYRSAFTPHGAWIAVLRFCDYYIRLFYDPADSEHRLTRCILRGRMIFPMDEGAVAFVPVDPLGNVRPPRNVVEELEVLAYALCSEPHDSE